MSLPNLYTESEAIPVEFTLPIISANARTGKLVFNEYIIVDFVVTNIHNLSEFSFILPSIAIGNKIVDGIGFFSDLLPLEGKLNTMTKVATIKPLIEFPSGTVKGSITFDTLISPFEPIVVGPCRSIVTGTDLW
jgi:hypothetical protein